MNKSIAYYVQFALAVVLANLVIGVLDGFDSILRVVAKAILAGVIAAALLVWFDRRRSRRANSTE
jgi:membrane associated rhomboid family serine protease